MIECNEGNGYFGGKGAIFMTLESPCLRACLVALAPRRRR